MRDWHNNGISRCDRRMDGSWKKNYGSVFKTWVIVAHNILSHFDIPADERWNNIYRSVFMTWVIVAHNVLPNFTSCPTMLKLWQWQRVDCQKSCDNGPTQRGGLLSDYFRDNLSTGITDQHFNLVIVCNHEKTGEFMCKLTLRSRHFSTSNLLSTDESEQLPAWAIPVIDNLTSLLNDTSGIVFGSGTRGTSAIL